MAYNRIKAWEVEYTDEFGDWFGNLDEKTREQIRATVRILADLGPGLGRLLVDTLTSSRHPNMKELRPTRGNVRILFAFDPRRTAILLIGGNKTHRWQEWHREMIPIADHLYDTYLRELQEEGLLP